MIVKINTPEGWHIIDNVDVVDYKPGRTDGTVGLCDPVDLLDFTQGFATTSESDMTWEMHLQCKEGTKLRTVLAKSPVYLLNDNGKTIERL